MRADWNSQVMLEQDFGITSIIFQDLMGFELRIDWFRSFWLEVNILVTDIPTIFEAKEVFISLIGRLVVKGQAIINTEGYKWCIENPILVYAVMMGSFSFQKLEGSPRKRR